MNAFEKREMKNLFYEYFVLLYAKDRGEEIDCTMRQVLQKIVEKYGVGPFRFRGVNFDIKMVPEWPPAVDIEENERLVKDFDRLMSQRSQKRNKR